MSKKILILSCFLLTGSTILASEAIIKLVTDKIGRPDEVLELGIKERQERLESLKKEKDQYEASKQSRAQELQKKISEIEKRIITTKEALKREPNNDFLMKVQSLLNDWFQVLKEQQKIHESILAHITERIDQLQEFLKDPNFKNFEREQRSLGVTAGRPFEYIQELNKKIIDLKKQLESLVSQEKDAAVEYENKKRYVTGVKETYQKKKDELANIHPNVELNEPFGLSMHQKGELVTLEEKIYRDKIILEEMRLRDIENKRARISMDTNTCKEKLHILENILSKEKSSIKVTDLDIFVARSDLSKRKQQVDTTIANLQKLIDQYYIKEDVLQDISRRYNVPLGMELDEWKLDLGKSIDKYIALHEVGAINDQVLLERREKELLETRKLLEQEQYTQESLQVDIEETYYRITAHKFKSENDITNEANKYKTMRNDAVAKNSECAGKRKVFAHMADTRRKALEYLHNKEKELKKLKETLFQNRTESYTRVLDLIHTSQALIKKHIKTIDEIVGVYDEIMNKQNIKISQLNFIIDELENIKLYRSEDAITLKDIRNIGSDLGHFLRDLKTYLSRVHVKAFMLSIIQIFETPLSWVTFILKLIMLVAFFILLRKYLPSIAQHFVNVGKTYRGLLTVSLLFSCLSDFFVRYAGYIIPWIIVYIFGQVYTPLPDPHVYVLFCLLSIPYCIYLANRLIKYFMRFNQDNNYVFISQAFEHRFIIILSILLYATIGIFLFREAFVQTNYLKSELPTVLLAINVIILQISLIFLLGKDQILHIIPTQTSFGEWIYKQVDTYFNLILFGVITLIVLSNPYVGYGRYIFSVLKPLVATILLVQVLIIAHNFLKRASASFFFNIKEEAVRERFHYAKTWYGIFVIFTMLAFIIFAGIIIAKLWHWPEALAKIRHWDDVKNWLHMPILMEGSEHPISVFSIVYIFSFIMGGMFIAFIFDKFVLHRIFDVLLVDHGVQNAVSSLTRYGILIIAFILGIQAVGLGAQISYFVAALLLGVGWVIKDPAYDFIAYFIILIQRPVKIGDYIRFDEDVRGVVRHITPRSVILRRRNSATIIVPNSQVMSKPFANWNYSRGFVAFDDIFLTVDYKEDPQRVKAICVEVLSLNPYILKSPAPVVRLYRFGAYGFVFQIRGFLSSSYTLDMWEIASDVRLAIAVALRKNNITMSSVRLNETMPEKMPTQASFGTTEFPEHRQADE
jgi:small-conductance mechanosensitive channel